MRNRAFTCTDNLVRRVSFHSIEHVVTCELTSFKLCWMFKGADTHIEGTSVSEDGRLGAGLAGLACSRKRGTV